MAAAIASNRDGRETSRASIKSELSKSAALAPTALCLLAALTPLAFAVPLFEPYITPKEILAQAGTTTLALLWLFTARKDLSTLVLTSAWFPIVALVAIGAGSILWSSNRSASIEEAQRLITYVLLFFVALEVMRRRESRTMLVTTLIFTGTIEAIYVLWQYVFGDPFFPAGNLPGKWRTFGTLGNPNWTGEFLAVTVLVTLGRLVELRKESKRSWAHYGTLAALILMLLALAATLARGSWVALVIGAGAFLIMRRHSRSIGQTLRTSILPLTITGITAILLIGLPLLTNRASLEHLLNLKSARGRIWMWLVTGSMILDAPFGGHGLGTFGSQFPTYQARLFSRVWSAPFVLNASFTTYAHNDYLQLGSELGVFALVAFCALLWSVLKRGRQLGSEPLALGCWAAVISLLVNAAFAFPLRLPASLMLFVVLTATVEASVAQRTVTLKRSAIAARVMIALLICGLGFLAYRSSYHRWSADAALWRADAALQSKQLNKAEISMRAAIYHAPKRVDGQAMLGRLHFERGDYDAALRAFDQAISRGFDVDVYEWKALVLEKLGRRDEAVNTLQELLWLRPDLIEARQKLRSLSAVNTNQVNQR